MLNKSKWRLLLVLLAVIAILMALLGPLFRPASADTEPTGFSNVTLSIYPEYDDAAKLGYPSLLVMLDGQIEGASAPVTVRFLVPQNAFMYSAGSGPRDKYQGGPPNRKVSDVAGWDEISYQLKTNIFVVEYYVPVPTSPDRSFDSVFIPLYPVNRLTVVVQEPRRSQNFNVVALTQSSTQPQQYTDGQGFKTHQYTYNTVQSGQTLSFSLSYTRNDNVPSLSPAPTNKTLIYGAIGAGVVLFGIALYFVTRKSSRRSSRPVRRRIDRPIALSRESEPVSTRFCTNCGAELESSQRFCPECGTKQRDASGLAASGPPPMQNRPRPKSKRRRR